jgi:hypothetical protein
MDALRAHANLEAAVAGWNAASLLTADYRPGSIVVGGVPFVEVPPIAGRACIDADKALLVPLGVPGLLEQYFAPDDSLESVNQPAALPFTSRAQELPMAKGLQIESQSNALALCTRPRAIVELTA